MAKAKSNARILCIHKEPVDFQLLNILPWKTIESCRCDGLCTQCYDLGTDLAEKAIIGGYL
jgi:hypothetical protein